MTHRADNLSHPVGLARFWQKRWRDDGKVVAPINIIRYNIKIFVL